MNAPASTCLGLIVPPREGEVPSDGAALYGARVGFIAPRLGLGEISPRGYEAVIDRVVELAVELGRAGASAVSLMGTSLSFIYGADFNASLEAEMARRTGLPGTTMSHAIVRGLRALGIGRVAVATAYIDDVNERLAAYLAASTSCATHVRGLAITGVREVGAVPASTLVDLCEQVFAADPSADGVLVSCGSLLTLDAITIVEARLGVRVVSSSPAGFWDLMRVAGLDASSPGHGRHFER